MIIETQLCDTVSHTTLNNLVFQRKIRLTQILFYSSCTLNCVFVYFLLNTTVWNKLHRHNLNYCKLSTFSLKKQNQIIIFLCKFKITAKWMLSINCFSCLSKEERVCISNRVAIDQLRLFPFTDKSVLISRSLKRYKLSSLEQKNHIALKSDRCPNPTINLFILLWVKHIRHDHLKQNSSFITYSSISGR